MEYKKKRNQKDTQHVCRLIKGFLLDVAAKIDENSYVCIGITKLADYILDYGLERILGPRLMAEDNSTDVLELYKFIGADEMLIKQILSFGYQHTNAKQLPSFHKYMCDYHVTLVFRKKAASE